MSSVKTRKEEAALIVSIDDGKANAVTLEMLAELGSVLDDAEPGDAPALVLTGREGMLSGGFDLKVLGGGDADQARALVTGGAELLLRLYLFPKPVVVACPGHAIAMGALLLLAADSRVGARGSFRIGLNEVAAGMTLPHFALRLAQDRLSKRSFERAAVQAELYAPDAARDAGFLDRVVEPQSLVASALEEAARLGGLRRGAFAATKRRAHGPAVAEIRAGLAADMQELLATGR